MNRKQASNSMNGRLMAVATCPLSSTWSSSPEASHMNETQITHSYLRSSAATGNGLKQCRGLLLMSSGQHPCNNYTLHIRPLFARVPLLNLFACIMWDRDKRSSFINAVIYIYGLLLCGHSQRAVGHQHFDRLGEGLTLV